MLICHPGMQTLHSTSRRTCSRGNLAIESNWYKCLDTITGISGLSGSNVMSTQYMCSGQMTFYRLPFQLHFFERKCAFFLILISLEFLSKGPIHNKSVLVQVIARYGTGDKTISVPLVVAWLHGAIGRHKATSS